MSALIFHVVGISGRKSISFLYQLAYKSRRWTLWGKFQKEETSVNKNRQLSNRNLIAA